MPDPRLPRGAFARLGFLLAIGAALVFAASGPSHARGLHLQIERRSILIDAVAVFESHLGQGNFTGLPGAWCAWAVSAVLRATGRRPLASGMAASALAYGPLELHPRRGDLVVMRTRRGRAGHVGLLVADFGDTVEIVSGNWGHRVARARISRRSVTAFVRV